MQELLVGFITSTPFPSLPRFHRSDATQAKGTLYEPERRRSQHVGER